MQPISRLVAVFPNSNKVPQFLLDCRLVVTMMTGNASFPNPTPPLSQISARLDTLEADEELARKRGKGAVQQRNVTLALACNDMRLLKAYVQSAADANPAEAESIIKSAGMRIGKKSARTKPPAEAKRGDVPGRVVLEARALRPPVQYRWQMSTDQQTWTDLPEAFTARTTVDGLTPATVYAFRLRTMTRKGLSDVSAVVSVIVH